MSRFTSFYSPFVCFICKVFSVIHFCTACASYLRSGCYSKHVPYSLASDFSDSKLKLGTKAEVTGMSRFVTRPFTFKMGKFLGHSDVPVKNITAVTKYIGKQFLERNPSHIPPTFLLKNGVCCACCRCKPRSNAHMYKHLHQRSELLYF
jgi:hypothetical protein